MATLERQTPLERRAIGKGLRKQAPRASHAEWSPAPERPDPVALLEEQNAQRIKELVPYRHQRMAESAFAFYRGSARIMASDLATTPVSGIHTQICGDAHLANFGFYGSAERDLVFDINDFDETLPGPWEWDLKRLATSFAIASRHNGFKQKDIRRAVEMSVRAYSGAMHLLADQPALRRWYAHVRSRDIAPHLAKGLRLNASQRAKLDRNLAQFFAKTMARDSRQALSKLATLVDGEHRFISDPPFIIPVADLLPSFNSQQIQEVLDSSFAEYRASLPDHMRHLLNRYRMLHTALKVVGVGSVGTRCFVVLFEGLDAQDPLILQVKEANRSVLEDYLPPSAYDHHGRRVVEGQRVMQATSDIFLGWSTSTIVGQYYWRQLRDMKGSVETETFGPLSMTGYAGMCGVTLALAHARAGDAAAIAGYIGRGRQFVDAIATFADAYADQNERDFAAFTQAIHTGRIPCAEASVSR
ncbi:MAG: DUF2252 domain-containing protein [Chloroflexi bacterium]|nr:MAG: DUF2252 domain-containing protein [Chloroflexota bacterium]